MRMKYVVQGLAGLIVLILVVLVTHGANDRDREPIQTLSGDHTKETVKGAPRIQFASLQYDFGKRTSGEQLKTSFTFRNIGDQVLVIERVSGG